MLQNKFLKIVGSVLCGAGLSILLIFSGLWACSLPVSTQLMAQQSAAADISFYTEEELNSLAIIVRDFTFGEISQESMQKQIDAIAQKYMPLVDPPVGGDLKINSEFNYENLSMFLGSDAISHLEDVAHFITLSKIANVFALGLFIAGLAILLFTKDTNAIRYTLTVSSMAILVILVLSGVYALIDFYSFFNLLHSLIFPAGSWLYPTDSLLISMYPLDFWMGMGLIWLASTVLCCLLCLGTSLVIRLKTHAK